MKTITLTGLDDALHQRLAARAAASQRSIEDEARRCVEVALASDLALDEIPERRWCKMETALDEALRETPTDFTIEDRQKYRDLARGYLRSQKSSPG